MVGSVLDCVPRVAGQGHVRGPQRVREEDPAPRRTAAAVGAPRPRRNEPRRVAPVPRQALPGRGSRRLAGKTHPTLPQLHTKPGHVAN